MSFLPGHFPGGALGGFRPAETTWAGVIHNSSTGTTKNISCTYGPEHATRHAYCLVSTAQNAGGSSSGNINSVVFDGVTCTQLFLVQSGSFHASAWGCALPSGASGTCTLTRTTSSGFGLIRANAFTVNYLRDPLTLIEKADFISDPQADPWTLALQTIRGGVILLAIDGPGPNSGSQITTSTTGVILDDHTFGASPNTSEICSAHYDDTPTNAALSLAFDALGAGNQSGTAISLR